MIEVIASRGRVLARAHTLVRLDIHTRVHRTDSFDTLGHLGAILAASLCWQLHRVDRSEHALLELDTAAHVYVFGICVVTCCNARRSCRINETIGLNRVKLDVRGSHMSVHLGQLMTADIVQFWHSLWALTVILTRPRTLISANIRIIPRHISRLVQMTL